MIIVFKLIIILFTKYNNEYQKKQKNNNKKIKYLNKYTPNLYWWNKNEN